MAIDLNGSNEYLYGQDSINFALTGDFTINIWFNATDYSNTPYLWDFSAGNNTLACYISAAGAIGALRGGGMQLLGGSVGAGEWHMYTLTRDGTTAYLYLDGAEVDNDSDTGTINATNSGATLGVAGGGGVNFFNGKFGLVEFYKGTALSQGELLHKFNSKGNDRIITNLSMRLLLLEKSSGQTVVNGDVKDYSPYRLTITVVNSPSYEGVPLNVNN